MEPFEDVIYPKGDPDAVSISKRDIELLDPDTFINDTIIDFYIKWVLFMTCEYKKYFLDSVIYSLWIILCASTDLSLIKRHEWIYAGPFFCFFEVIEFRVYE